MHSKLSCILFYSLLQPFWPQKVSMFTLPLRFMPSLPGVFPPLFGARGHKASTQKWRIQTQRYVTGSCNIWKLNPDDICLLLTISRPLFRPVSASNLDCLLSSTSSVRSRLLSHSRTLAAQPFVEKSWL